ncbi:MAG: class I SAM-dependent methyltransferase [Verrucomicrobiota bacterium]|nr:class I SAM-dependent methyltransferase [Verrucomicrobiota bacterium]
MNIADENRQVYEQDSVVAEYVDSAGLQPPEQTILALLKERLAGWKMLDVGVGAGRTTAHFLPLVREYVGIDYAAAMVEACRRKFAGAAKPAEFQQMDARDLRFADDSFEFVFFSFNGIDSLVHEDRIKVLREMKRVCSPHGVVCFSAHNLWYLPLHFRARPGGGIMGRLRGIARRLIYYWHNGRLSSLLAGEHAQVVDGIHRRGIRNYYIKPEAQFRQLQELGFARVRVFDYHDGKELQSWERSREPWLHYLCEMSEES